MTTILDDFNFSHAIRKTPGKKLKTKTQNKYKTELPNTCNQLYYNQIKVQSKKDSSTSCKLETITFSFSNGAQLERLFRRVRKAINDINTNYNIADSENEMKKILSNLEDATTYLVDHPTEHATAEDLINRFTDIQDEHDDIMDEFRQMLQENTAETTPQQQNTNATTVQTPHTADSVQQQTILDRDSSQTSALSSSSHQPGSSVHQTVEDQNFSDSRDTPQQAPQTGFEIDRPPLQRTEHDTTNANLSFNIVTEQQFIPAAVSRTSSNGQSRAYYSLMTRPPKVKIEPFDGNPMK